jgi:hypothetical protein
MIYINAFNKTCPINEVRCIRNNIKQSVKVINFDHLYKLWSEHPKVTNNGNAQYFLQRIKNNIPFVDKSTIGIYGTMEYMFRVSFMLSKTDIMDYYDVKH